MLCTEKKGALHWPTGGLGPLEPSRRYPFLNSAQRGIMRGLMALDTLDPDDPTSDGSRWDEMRTRGPADALIGYWMAWVFITGGCALASFTVLNVIFRRERLWSQPFNRFIVALCIPDFLFSFFCVFSCLANSINGEWFGGNAACQWQAFYCMFGLTASIWMNVVITKDLHRMALCCSKMTKFTPITLQQQSRQVGCVYSFSGFFSLLIGPGNEWVGGPLPARVNAQRGLACLPIEYSVESTLFMWLFTINVMLVIPLALIVNYFFRAYRLLWVNSTGQSAVDKQTNKGMFVFFARLFVVFAVMWVPTIVFMWTFVFTGASGAAIAFLSASWGHLQGFVSAYLYIKKDDIKDELLPMLPAACGGRVRVSTGTVASVSVLSEAGNDTKISVAPAKVLADA